MPEQVGSKSKPGTPSSGGLAGRIAWEMQHEVISSTDRANLRRLRPGDSGGPAFWKVAVRLLEPAGVLGNPDSPARNRCEVQWSSLLACMASGPPQAKRSLGEALVLAGVAEARVLRLLRSQGDALLDAVRATCHQIASAGSAFDWNDAAALVLSDGTAEEEPLRRQIAYDYYRHAAGTNRA